MKGDTKVMSSSPPNKNHKRAICTVAKHNVTEGPLQAMHMRGTRAETSAAAVLFSAALMEQSQL